MANRLVEALGALLAPRIPSVTTALAKAATTVASEAIEPDRADGRPGVAFARPDVRTVGMGIMNGLFPSGTPPRRGERELHLAYNTMPYLRSTVSLLARRISGTPWKAYTRRLRTGIAVKCADLDYNVPKAYRMKAMARLKALGELEELQTHPMLEFLKRGNLLLDGRLSLRSTAIAMLLAGDAFWLIERSTEIANPDTGLGLPIRYWPIPAFWVYQTPSMFQPYFRISYGGWHGYIKECDIVWFRDVNPAMPFGRGTGMAEALAKDLEWGDYAADFLRASFANHMIPAGLVSIIGGTETQIDEFEERWKEENQGPGRSNRLHFTGYEVKVDTFDPHFAEGELSELLKLQRDAIRQSYHTPPEVYGELTHSNRSTIDAADYLLEKYGIEPHRDDLRHTLQRRLAAEWDPALVLDYESEVPEDIDRRVKLMGVRPYAFKNNDVRKAAGEEPWAGAEGDERPPVPTTAPTDAESIATGGGLGGAGMKAARGHKTKAAGGGDTPASDDEEPAVTARQREIINHALQGLSARGSLLDGFAEDLDEWIRRELRDLGIEPVSFLRNPAVQEYVQELAAEQVTQIDDTTRNLINGAIDDAVQRGEGAEATARVLEGMCDDMGRERGLMIARTEVGSAANWANLFAYEQSGVVQARQWICRTNQSDPRDGGPKGDKPDHASLHLTIVDLGEPFVDPVTGAELDYPGDGDAADRINCHCGTAPVVRSPEGFDTKAAKEWDVRIKSAALERFERHLGPWRARVEARIAAHFEKVKQEIRIALR